MNAEKMYVDTQSLFCGVHLFEKRIWCFVTDAPRAEHTKILLCPHFAASIIFFNRFHQGHTTTDGPQLSTKHSGYALVILWECPQHFSLA
jgi:hypothetical protein